MSPLSAHSHMLLLKQSCLSQGVRAAGTPLTADRPVLCFLCCLSYDKLGFLLGRQSLQISLLFLNLELESSQGLH